MSGEITNIRHVAMITGQKGDVRSNHYHMEGVHFLEVKDGRILYKERNLDGSGYTEFPVERGEVVRTDPMKVHRVEFLENSLLESKATKVATGSPDGEYERDTVAVEW